MKLQDILYKVGIRSVIGKTDMEINEVEIDSREVRTGTAFIAVRGSAADGHQFIDKAITNGAVAIVCETLPVQQVDGITYVQVENTAAAAGYMAHNFFGQPSEKVKLVVQQESRDRDG